MRDRTVMAESARFVALEREASRLLDRALEETDPERALSLIRESNKLLKELSRA